MAASTNPVTKNWLNAENLEIIMDIWQFLLSGTEIIMDILMFICSVYLILSYSVPAFNNPDLVTNALAVMVAAPELLLAGAFIKSSRLRLEGNSKGWLLTIVCWSFLLLTIVTVGSLVYKLDDNTAKILVVARCGLGIAYGLLSIIAYREAKEKREQEIAMVQSIPDHFVPYLQQLEQLNQAALTQARELLTHDSQEQLTHMRELLTRDNQAFLTQQEESNRRALTPLAEELSRVNEETLTRLLGHIDQSNQQALALFTSQIKEENEVALQRAVEWLEQVSDRKVASALTRIERVRVILDNSPTQSTLTPGKGQLKMIEGSKVVESEGQHAGVKAVHSGGQTGGQESEPSGVKAQKFIAMYLATEGSLPRVKTVMEATGCVKNTARKYLKLAGSTEQDED